MRRRTKILLAIAAVLLPVGLWAAYWFQPWRIWTNDTVHDALPAVATQTPATATPSTATPSIATPSIAGPPYPSVTSTTPPRTTDAQHDVLVSRGSFVSYEHHTTGSASIVRLADGSYVLAIAALDTSEGPDVHVWLTDRPVTKGGGDSFADGYHVDLGGLKGNHGSLLYTIPASADLTRVRSIAIWCQRFDVGFGAAQLRPA